MAARGIDHAAIAITGPAAGDEVRLTNSQWPFSLEQTRQRLGRSALRVGLRPGVAHSAAQLHTPAIDQGSAIVWQIQR